MDHIKQLLVESLTVDGEIVECGLGKLNTFKIILKTLISENHAHRVVWGYDSFEGLPEDNFHQKKAKRKTHQLIKKGWKQPDWVLDLEKTRKQLLLSGYPDANLKLIKGFFEKSLFEPNLPKQISYLHLDCDLYSSYKVCLNRLFNKVSAGGIIIFDEYKYGPDLDRWPGAAIAIDEFFKENNLNISDIKRIDNKFYFVKQ